MDRIGRQSSNTLRRARAACAAVVALLGLAPAAPAGGQEPGGAGQGVVRGTVVDAATGEPLADVRVAVEGTGRGAVSDGRGRFALAGVPAGEQMLVATVLGRPATRQAVRVPAGGVAEVRLALAVDPLLVPGVVVSVSREAQRRAETPATVQAVGAAALRAVRPAHPSEVMGRVPGVWVNVTGGEGHMMAMRQPKTTNPVYLYLEDGVPVRSTGFFNHNALYEVNIPQAERIEVLKGPASALYGSDAIGGVVNVLTRPPAVAPEAEVALEAGSHGWTRLRGSASGPFPRGAVRLDVNLTRTDGWRQGTSYDRESATLRWDGAAAGGSLRVTAAASRIDQQTAGASLLGEEDYRARPELNYAPISYRRVGALRLSAAYERRGARSLLGVTPYVRWNTMALLPDWMLAFDPVRYESWNASMGLLARYRLELAPWRARLVAGADVDHSPGGRREWAIVPARDGRVWTSYDDGPRLYDYRVTFHGVSPYLQVEASPLERVRLLLAARYDRLGYDYDTRLEPVATGRHRRPADARVRHARLSPKLGAAIDAGPALQLWTAYQQGFRVPSEGQLFRQGQAENTVGLRPIRAENVEAGARGQLGPLGYEVVAYRLEKRDDIVTLRNPDGTQEVANAGRTLHRGVEVGLGVRPAGGLALEASWSVARHSYEEWRPRPELDLAGREIEEAPREIGSVRLTWSPATLTGASASLEWARVGPFWLDAENTHRYGGHDLLHLRAEAPVGRGFTAFARVLNLTDRRYAEGGMYTPARGVELAPGAPRTVYLGLEWRGGRVAP